MREKRKAFLALECALRDTAYARFDPDNFAGSCKDLLDGCRHAGLIPGDEPWRIIYETAQEQVKSYAQERTLIEIKTPGTQ
jgi:hypothetical protein